MNSEIEKHPNIVLLKKLDPNFLKDILPILSKNDRGAQLTEKVAEKNAKANLDESSNAGQAWVQVGLFLLTSIDENDIRRIANGASLIALLRDRYETVRLDLA